MSKFRQWTDQEWANSTKEERLYLLRTLATEHAKNDELFAHQNQAFAAAHSVIFGLQAPARWLRAGEGKLVDGAATAGLVDAHWRTKENEEYRRSAVPLWQGYGTFVNSVLEASRELGPLMAGAAMGSSATGVIAAALQRTAHEAKLGFPWAKAHAEEVENHALSTLDPMLVTSWLTDGLKAVGATKEIERLMPFANNVMAASEAHQAGAEMVGATKALWGGDTGAPVFVEAIRDMMKKGASVEDVAKWMYHNAGLRTSEWAMMNKMPLSDYFKRGWNLYSPRLKDTAQDYMWIKQAIQSEQNLALELVPNLSKRELEQVQWAMKNVPRTPFDPVGSFVANFNKMATEGKINPMDVAPETFEKMKTIAGQLSAGWRENSEWRAAYTPSDHAKDMLIGEASEGLSSRGWQEHQNNYRAFTNADEYRRAVAKVQTRVFKADNVDAFARNVHNRIANIEGAISKAGQDFNAPHEVWSKADKPTRNLFNERAVLQNMVRDLKMMKDSTDPIAKLAEKDPTQVATWILKQYTKGLRTYKMLQLKWSLPLVWHRGLDMGLRAGVETGSIPAAEIAAAVGSNEFTPALDYMGRKMDFFASPVEGLVEGVPTGRHFLGKGFSPKVEAIDGAVQNHIGKYVYDKTYASGLRSGLSEEPAHKYAFRAAKERLDLVHGMYQNKSSVMRILDKVFPYAGHYGNRVAYWATLATEHPAEAYVALRARELQEDLSIDKRGAVRIGSTDFGFDPMRRFTGVQVMEPLIHPEEIWQKPANFAQKVTRGLQALTGQPYPHFDALAQLMGISPPASTRPMTDLEIPLAYLSKAITGNEILPSDPLYAMLGANPGEDRQAYTARLANIQASAAKVPVNGVPGKPIAADEALHRAESAQRINHLGAYIGLVRMTPGEQEVYSALRDVNQSVWRAEPEYKSAMREQVINEALEKHGVDVSKIAPLDPEARHEAVKNLMIIEESKSRALLQQDERKTFDSRIDTAVDELSRHPAATLFKSVYDAFVSPAGATEAEDKQFVERINKIKGASIGQNPPELKVRDYQQGLNNRIYVPTNGSPKDRDQAVLDVVNLNNHLSNLSLLPSVQAKAEYIKTIEQPDGSNPLYESLARLEVNKKGQSPAAAHYKSTYDFTYNNKPQINGDLDPVSQRSATSVAQSLKNYVESGTPGAVRLWRAPVDEVQAAYARGDIPHFGFGMEAVDKYAVLAAQQAISPGSVSMGEQKWEQRTQDKYQDFGKFVGLLQNAQRPGAAQDRRLREAIDFGSQGIAAGRLPPDVYTQLNELPKYRDLIQRAEDAGMAHQADAVWDHITYKKDGKVIGINPVALAEMATSSKYANWRPALQELASGNQGDQKALTISSAVADMPPSIGKYVSMGIESSPDARALYKTENFESMTGRSHPDFGAALLMDQMGSQELVRRATADQPPSPLAPVAQPKAPPQPGSPLLSSGVTPESQRPAMSEAPTPFNFSYTGPGAPGMGISSPAQFLSTAWNDYSIAHAEWRVNDSFGFAGDRPEPSFAGQIGQTWKGMEGPNGTASLAQVRTGVGAVQIGYQLASIGMAASGEEMPSEVSAGMAGLSTGMSIAAAGGFTPPALIVGAIAGIAVGVMGSQKGDGGRGQANAEGNRINQQRLDLERQQFAEQLKQTSIRDLRTRESDLARSVGGLTPGQRAPIEQHLAAFQRKPTYQSRIGLVDAAERAVSGALKPRW